MSEPHDRTALMFGGLAFQSQDIAITEDGPIVVEVNSGSSFTLTQMVSGEGMLDDETKAFFERAGVNFKSLPV